MLRGSCLCGVIQYTISADISGMSHCHCKECQKAHGAAFGTYGRADKRAFRFTEGEDSLGMYRSSKNVTRTFCTLCGSTLQFIDGTTPYLNFAIATLDDPINDIIDVEIWCKERASWLPLDSSMSSHDTFD